MAGALPWFPYARVEGGTGGPFVDKAKALHRYTVWVLALVFLLSFSGPAGILTLLLMCT